MVNAFNVLQRNVLRTLTRRGVGRLSVSSRPRQVLSSIEAGSAQQLRSLASSSSALGSASPTVFRFDAGELLSASNATTSPCQRPDVTVVQGSSRCSSAAPSSSPEPTRASTPLRTQVAVIEIWEHFRKLSAMTMPDSASVRVQAPDDLISRLNETFPARYLGEFFLLPAATLGPWIDPTTASGGASGCHVSSSGGGAGMSSGSQTTAVSGEKGWHWGRLSQVKGGCSRRSVLETVLAEGFELAPGSPASMVDRDWLGWSVTLTRRVPVDHAHLASSSNPPFSLG